MRCFVCALTIAGFFFACVPLHADYLSDILFNRFGDYLDSLRIQAGIPGLSAAVINQRDIVWDRAFGLQDINRAIATRTDTPFHLDGLTQLFTASVILRCVEEGQVLLDDPIGRFDPSSAEPSATVRQILTHTSAGPAGLVFAYRPDRLDSLAFVIRTCAGASFRATVANLLDRLAMADSVPGPDVIHLVAPADGISLQRVERYTAVLGRLAIPYAVDNGGHTTPSRYAPITLTPHDGLISTVLDFAKFDLALRSAVLLRPDTLAAAWRAPLDGNGQPLPHGMGWFVQNYKGEWVLWQFGLDANASSSLVVTVPGRGFTVILFANSDGLVKQFGLAAGDLTISPFGRVVLGLLVGKD